MSAQSAEERTHLIERIAAEDPELAAHLSLRVTNAAADTELLPTLPLTINVGLPERFQVDPLSGTGWIWNRLSGYDRERGHDVALKILRDPDPDTLFRFKQEFRSLATLRHPHLIEFYDLFEYRQLWFFTMELVSGPSFLRHVRSGQQCDLGRLRSALRDLAGALRWLHANKLVHRDIKPAQRADRRIGTPGVARFRSRDASVRPGAVGNLLGRNTSIYGPGADLECRAVDGAADWYAVGVMLYEALTGRLPFTGTMVELLAAKASADPIPPSSISPDVPAAWSQLCLRLLARKPGSRPDAQDVLEWLGEDEVSAARPQLCGQLLRTRRGVVPDAPCLRVCPRRNAAGS